MVYIKPGVPLFQNLVTGELAKKTLRAAGFGTKYGQPAKTARIER